MAVDTFIRPKQDGGDHPDLVHLCTIPGKEIMSVQYFERRHILVSRSYGDLMVRMGRALVMPANSFRVSTRSECCIIIDDARIVS